MGVNEGCCEEVDKITEESDKFNVKSEGTPACPIEHTVKGMADVARLEAGSSFGELSLIDGKNRMATIKCLTRCHFLVLTRQDWK